jgi:ankyrin repeat protein
LPNKGMPMASLIDMLISLLPFIVIGAAVFAFRFVFNKFILPNRIPTMLEAGADVNTRSEKEETSLHFAAINGTPENITALLEAGADVNARDKNGETPLLYSARSGTPENIIALLEAGADVNARNKDGDIPQSHKRLSLKR